MVIKFKKFHEKATTPRIATSGAAGADLVAVDLVLHHEEGLDSTTTYEYHLGLGVEIPAGYVGLLFPRSSIKNTGLHLTNAVGVIDSDYRGELKAFFKGPKTALYYKPGERVVQLVIVPMVHPIFVEENLTETKRGENGFGSTGK